MVRASSASAAMSRPVSRSVPRRHATSVSVGGCDVESDIEDSAVSITSTPASTALSSAAVPMPLV